MKLLTIYRDWLKYNGSIIVIDGLRCMIRMDVVKQYYPYEAEMLSCHLEPIDKDDPSYLETKLLLKDDWSFDGFDLADEWMPQLETLPSEVVA